MGLVKVKKGRENKVMKIKNCRVDLINCGVRLPRCSVELPKGKEKFEFRRHPIRKRLKEKFVVAKKYRNMIQRQDVPEFLSEQYDDTGSNDDYPDEDIPEEESEIFDSLNNNLILEDISIEKTDLVNNTTDYNENNLSENLSKSEMLNLLQANATKSSLLLS